ncbi:hypothetical protein [Pedobacter rhizosphaerae]|uniref:Uncharacterized protein n=1 Tax=Pedobacter rhizosphaerae TaxID=390241 RepID=A0A1H9VEV1_9SPHI|nr:hypothetical protein [Pedobacter rhizosphaerae]SES20108.1 hypothetical protein SAMN04488023_1429 [Pedobacter rhizosphaerae]
MKIKFSLSVLLFFLATACSRAQIIFLDENKNLTRVAETVLLADQTAQDGQCIFRPASAVSSTMWYGPYLPLSAGQYLVSFRLKVASNASTAAVLSVDIVSASGAETYGGMWIAPNMFKNSNSWELFTIPVTIPNGITNLEVRGITFQTGITDVSLDYVQISPAGINGIYTSDFTLTNKGDLGLGTMSPKEKLSVNGKIRAHEVKVETANWPDYVFKPEYDLPTLSEIEKLIKAMDHLPEIPSAKEVEINGVALGEMNKLLLKKVEELTLHLIEKDKQLSSLKSEVAVAKHTAAENTAIQNQKIKALAEAMNQLMLKSK